MSARGNDEAPPRFSTAHSLAEMTDSERAQVLEGLTAEQLEALQFNWPFWARPDQLPPKGAWRTWLLLGGRGSGKTRPSAEWVRAEIESGRRRRIALIGATADAIRRDMVEGPSGILSIAPSWCRPSYEPSTRKIIWPNGGVALLFSAEEPDRLRGPNLDGLWLDEFCACPNIGAVWDMAMMALRIPGPTGVPPQAVVSTTPKPMKQLRALMNAASTVVTRARTVDNSANLDPATLAYLQERYSGTSLGRQELDAEFLDEMEGALWNRAMIDASRVQQAPTELKRIVVAVDPAGGTGKGSTETGIIVAGVTGGAMNERHAYILADRSGKYSPEQWARTAIAAYHDFKADCVVAERNFGGDMVEHTLRQVDYRVRVEMVTASRGKALRAEPVVALFEQQKVHHVGFFSELEEQLCGWDPLGSDPSPDRLDALVWAVTKLSLTNAPTLVFQLRI